jgi:hypothetical protein
MNANTVPPQRLDASHDPVEHRPARAVHPVAAGLARTVDAHSHTDLVPLKQLTPDVGDQCGAGLHLVLHPASLA